MLSGVTHTVNKVFSNHSLALRALRGVGMAVINHVPILRRGLMNEASGIGGDLPALMVGRKI
jgi:2-octaprenyl-6-methoxyphenol hydroxylase